jgi:opacity protein-like surface antigen
VEVLVTRVHGRWAAILAVLALGATGNAGAQEQVPAGGAAPSEVRVLRDRTTIWSRNPSMVLAVVTSGTVLRAIARDDRWIEVLVPPKQGGKGNTGFVLATHVEHVAGTPDIPVRPPRRNESAWDEPGSGSKAAAPAVKPPTIGVRGFASGSYMLFQAKDSFDAVFGSEWQPMYGGGAQVVLYDRLFVEGSFEQFKKTGERVAVSDGEVFPLGIDDRVTINPITVSAGYRFRSSRSLVSYVGGGLGSYRLRETSDFADPSENVDERHTSYHALGGVEVSVSKWVFAAFEAQYTSVPDGLGDTGVAEAFDESNLGGMSLRVKVLVGR